MKIPSSHCGHDGGRHSVLLKLYCGGVRRGSAYSNTQRLAGEEYYEIDQENNLFGYANGESTKEKGQKEISTREKQSNLLYVYMLILRNERFLSSWLVNV